MRFNFFGGKEKEHNYLLLTPVRNHGHEDRDDGLVNVLIPRFKSEFAKKFLSKTVRTPHIKANLDEFGSAIWRMIDGKSNVEQIGVKLIEKFGDKIEPVYERLTRFLTDLHRYKFISFIELQRVK